MSGVVLVVLFAIYLPELLAARPPSWGRQVEIILFTGRMKEVFSRLYDVPYGSLRNYTPVCFNGRPLEDDVKLGFSMLRVQEIIHQGDTINGLHFSFADSATYSTFIRTLDMLKGNRAVYYLIDNGQIWFWHKPD